MLQVNYPPADKVLDLTGIISIKADESFDTLFLGDMENGYLIGYIGFSNDLFTFRLNGNDYEFPARDSYEEMFFDIFRVLANDPEFAQELAILTTRKFMKDELDN